MSFDDDWDRGGGVHAAKAYWNALSILREAWLNVTGEPLPTKGGNAKSAFKQAVDQLQVPGRTADEDRRLREFLDVDTLDELEPGIAPNRPADLDEFSPKAVKRAILAAAHQLG